MWEVFFGKEKKSQPTQLFPFFPVYCTESLSFWTTLSKLSTYSYLSLSKVFQVALQLQMCCTSMTSKRYLLFNYIIYLILNYNCIFRNLRLLTFPEWPNIKVLSAAAPKRQHICILINNEDKDEHAPQGNHSSESSRKMRAQFCKAKLTEESLLPPYSLIWVEIHVWTSMNTVWIISSKKSFLTKCLIQVA